MMRRRRAFGIGVAALAVGALVVGGVLAAVIAPPAVEARAAKDKPKIESVKFGDYKIVGPYTHKNLAVFLIRGEDKIKGKKFLTLAEAMEQDKIIIHETSNVGELVIENPSSVEIYIQAGDIVKGGKQDRVLAFDIIVPSKTKQMRIKSYCVERGRWSARGSESARQFGSSSKQLASKRLKLAVRQSGSQGEVWRSVADVQEKLSENVGGSVRSARSESSLQLSLEDDKVKEAVAKYVKKLARATRGENDDVGYAFAINGKINSADVYANRALFKKLWPKLLEATAIEAVAEFKKGRKFDPMTAEDIKKALEAAQKSRRVAEQAVNARIKLRTRESPAAVVFETQDAEEGGEAVRAHYLFH